MRELKNVLVRAAALAQGSVISRAELPREIVEADAAPSSRPSGSLRNTEREMILQALANAQGNIVRAAACLGIHRATLHRKLKKYGFSASEAHTT